MDCYEVVDALELGDEDEFKLRVVEALGTLTLAVHHLRGRINWLEVGGAVHLTQPETRAEFARHNAMIAELEEVLWELLPPRAILLALRRYRLTGEMDPDYLELLQGDYRGRVPYTAKPMELEEIMKRIADVGTYTGGEIVRD